ncbi:Bicupin, oxalate decarboxylase/oxidase [Pholiota conissans]|uniref:Bicupin, oxalate decarboxylase/oxidase n=1 Tax=Pholiota conissans TaxID=109636 RepID=A0A9P6D344_9AGAR|nr:Bicupin, oxalate decarboxylase/oxidase [Pholiota conissans]
MWCKILSVSLLIAQHSISVTAAPTSSISPQPPVQYTNSNPNNVLWKPYSNITPQPIRDGLGASVLGPQNVPMELQNADLLASPTTDNGNVENFKWPMSASHTKLKNGGWTRQQNVGAMPIAEDLAGVNMRLEAGSIRELHWHTAAEWGYVLKGDMRISTITPEGQVWVGDVSEGDIWYFPAGNPHSLQAKDTYPEGSEFLLIFDKGTFSEDSTFQLTDWLAHVPKSVVAKNFGLPNDLRAFDHIPANELYIFPGTPPPQDVNDDMVVPNDTPNPYTFQFSKVKPEQKQAGTVKIVDSRSFNVSTTIAAAEVELEVGGLRELHWHPTQPEWTFFLSGQARITLFASQSNAATYDFLPGDVAYIPPSFGHYIENIGDTPLKFVEVLKSDLFQDISLSQWLALTPPELIKAHLGFSDETISHLSRKKLTLVK